MALTERAQQIFDASHAVPLDAYLADAAESLQLLPADKIQIPGSLEEFLENIGVTDFEVKTREVGEGQYLSTASVDLVFARELSFDLPGLDGISFVIGSNEGMDGTRIHLELDWGEHYEFRLGGAIALRFARHLLKPVQKTESGWEEIPGKHSEIAATMALSIDGEGNIGLTTGEIKLEKSMIADSGVVVEGTVIPVFTDDLDSIRGLPTDRPNFLQLGWRGVYIPVAAVHLPPALGIKALSMKDAYIGHGGFTGSIAADLDFSGELFGIKAKLTRVEIGFRQNALTAAGIEGTLTVPYFEAPIAVAIGFTLDGAFKLKLKGTDGALAKLELENVLEIRLESVAFEYEKQVFTFKLGGTLKPRLLEDKFQWPELQIKELAIDSRGGVHLDGGWINLPEKYALDFNGFQFEISKLGFGRAEEGDRKWIGFSGGLRLVEQLPLGVSVEGLRFSWRDGADPDVQVTFNGIGVEFTVPEVLHFKGSVSYAKALDDSGQMVERFDGDINLNIMAVGLEIDAKIVVGSVLSPQRYTFFGIYLGLELPSGIPLGPTSLGLYGLAGLFAMNFEPNKKRDEEWYGMDKPGWYLKAPKGVSSLVPQKWAPRKDSIAVGAGVTIGTVFDNGFTFAGKFLFAIVFPGPILLLEGKMNILKERKKLNENPVFRTLVVLDFREGSFLFGLSVDFSYGSGGELVQLAGSSEIYVNSNRPDDWHLWIGKREPREKRMRAQIIKLLRSEFYLMIDQKQLAMGSWTGVGWKWELGPIHLVLEAWIEWNVLANFKPLQLHGDFWMHGQIHLGIGPIGLGMTLDARLDADVFKPFHVVGTLDVQVDLPWPLPDFGFGIKLEWGPEPVPPPLPKPLKEVAIGHEKVTLCWPLPTGRLLAPRFDAEALPGLLEEIDDAEIARRSQEIDAQGRSGGGPLPDNIPVVPLDARPILTFGRPVHDDAGVGMTRSNPDPAEEIVGDPDKNQGSVAVRYSLARVEITRYNPETRYWVTPTDKDGNPLPVYGSWLAVPSAGGARPQAAQTKLWLWQKNPFRFSRASNVAWGNWFHEDYCQPFPCPPPPDRDETVRCDFEEEAPRPAVVSPWHFRAKTALRLYWGAPHRPVIEERRLIPGFSRMMSVLHDRDLEITIVLPKPAQRVEVAVDDATAIEMTGFDSAGRPHPHVVLSPFHAAVDAGREKMETVLLRRRVPVSEELPDPPVRTSIAEVAYTIRWSEEGRDWRDELERHVQQQTRFWAGEGAVFEPHTIYRLGVTTRVAARGLDALPDFQRTMTLVEYAYFRTEGPPGLASLSAPEGSRSSASSGNTELPAADRGFEGLSDLTPYVRQTVPPTVPPPGQPPVLPRPVYRAYDIGVQFNENYVDLMYRRTWRDLGTYLFDLNNRPVRDAHGRLVAPANRWGQAETLKLSEIDRLWIKRNADRCAPIDVNVIRRDDVLETQGYLLAPETQYEARLLPALVHDDFHVYEKMGISSPGVRMGSWTTAGETGIGEGELKSFSEWRVESLTVEGVRTFFLRQTRNHAAGGPDQEAALLWYDHPAAKSWSSYRLSVYLRTGSLDARGLQGGLGLVFRYQPGRNPQYYLFQMSNVAGHEFHRLAVVRNGSYKVLAERKEGYESGQDYAVSIEVIQEEIRIHVGDELLFLWPASGTVADAADRFAAGTVGLWAWKNPEARFSDLRVEDLRPDALAVYRFKFATSKYANFFHHLHSFQDETWPAEVREDPSASLASAVLPDKDLTVVESTTYEAVAAQVFGTSPASPAEVQVTRVLAKSGDATTVPALVLRSPEPIDWRRVGLAFGFAPRQATPGLAPGAVKIVAAAASAVDPAQDTVTLLVREELRPSGLRIEYRFRAAMFVGVESSDEDGEAAEPGWVPFHTFASDEPVLPAGTRVVVHSGVPDPRLPQAPSLTRRFAGRTAADPLPLPADGFEIRLVGGHTREIVPASAFQPVEVKVLRKADGTGLVLVPASGTAWLPGCYRLELTYRRDNQARDPESLVLSESGDRQPEVAGIEFCLP